MRSIQDFISPQQMHCVPTDLMFADVLTKHSAILRETFRKWIKFPIVKLKESEHQKEKYTSVNYLLVHP